MTRVDLTSSLLHAAMYLDHNAVLELKFRDGTIYHYVGVPAHVYQELLTSQSKGRYFNQHIKNRFSYAKIDTTNGAA